MRHLDGLRAAENLTSHSALIPQLLKTTPRAPCWQKFRWTQPPRNQHLGQFRRWTQLIQQTRRHVNFEIIRLHVDFSCIRFAFFSTATFIQPAIDLQIRGRSVQQLMHSQCIFLRNSKPKVFCRRPQYALELVRPSTPRCLQLAV